MQNKEAVSSAKRPRFAGLKTKLQLCKTVNGKQIIDMKAVYKYF
jgi:hypothetical protein